MVDSTRVTPDDDIPACAFELLLEHVNTFEKLELLVTVMDGGQSMWSLDAISSALRISATQLRPHLDGLRASGLLRLIPGKPYRFRYDPASREVGEAAEALHTAYQRNRGAMIAALRIAESGRARRTSADEFASAFVVRKPIEEDSDD